MKHSANQYKRHRFPPEIIQYAVWLYCRFNLSHRDIGNLLARRGILVTRAELQFVQIENKLQVRLDLAVAASIPIVTKMPNTIN
jgi:hypothetical protein